jgi:predicted anti-sigma-YlaC factor YlaD
MKHIDSNTLWHYLTGDSSKDQALHIKKHLANCEDCMREFELLSQIEITLHAVDEETTPFGFSDMVIRKIENEVALESKSDIVAKFFPYAILGGFTLAILTAIIAGVGLDVDLTQLEGALNSQVGILILTACGLLWGLYFIDRICKKIFVPVDYLQSQ